MRRKEYTKKTMFGYKTVVYDKDNPSKKVEGHGNTKKESIDKAYKKWREKYR